MRSLTPNRRGRRKAAAGVCYLSPEKAGSGGCGEYDDFYCTDIEVIGGDREESGVEIVGEKVEMVRERGAEMVREREESSAEKVEMVREREEIAGEKVEMVRESSAEIVGVEMVREREESIAEKVEMVREIAGEKVEMVREREEIANLIKPVSLTTKSTLHVPLEPRPNSHTPKPVLRPEIQVLSKSCHSYVRSSSFYGTVPRKYMTYKRSHSVNGDTIHPLRHSDGEGKRQLPLSVTRPMLFTRLEREWGVVMDGVGGEGGGASSGTRKQSTKCKGECVIRQHTMMNENTTEHASPGQRTKNTSLEEMAKKGKGKEVAAATEKASSCEGVRRGKRVGEVGDKGGGEKRSRRAKDPNVKSQDPFCPRCNPVDMIIDHLLGKRSDVELHSICPSCKPIPLEKKMNKLLGIC